jgi:hypothetical protein
MSPFFFQRLKDHFPVSQFRKTEGEDISLSATTAGTSGIVTGIAGQTAIGQDGVPDLSGIVIRALPYYTVRVNNGEQKVKVGALSNGTPVTLPGPRSTRNLEFWHADGVDPEFIGEARRAGFILDPHIGYKKTAGNQGLKLRNELRQYMKTAHTAAEIDAKVNDLADKYFFGLAHDTILEGGAWHSSQTAELAIYKGSTAIR